MQKAPKDQNATKNRVETTNGRISMRIYTRTIANAGMVREVNKIRLHRIGIPLTAARPAA